MDNQLVDYSRQAEFDEEIGRFMAKDESNIIIGCGGVGFWLGLFLAMNGYQDFFLIDGEKIDQTNLNRIPVPQTWMGTNKAIALRKLIRSLRPATRVVVLTAHITEDTLGVIQKFHEGQQLYHTTVWDTTDNALIQTKINAFVNTIRNGRNSATRQVKYRKIGYEAWNVGCYENYDVWVDEENYRPGYQTSRANAITSAIAAGLGFFARGLNISHDTTFNIKDMLRQGIPPNTLSDYQKSLLQRARDVINNAIYDYREGNDLSEDSMINIANELNEEVR